MRFVVGSTVIILIYLMGVVVGVYLCSHWGVCS